MTVSYYPPKGADVNLDTVALVVIAIGVWVLVIAGTNAV